MDIKRGFSGVNKNSIVGGGYSEGEAAVKEGSSVLKFGRGNYLFSKEEEKSSGFL